MRRRDLHWLSPGALDQRTGGYLYNARMMAALRDAGWTVTAHELPGSWPAPAASDLQECAARLGRIEAGAVVIADGLLWPGLGDQRAALVEQHPVIVLVHSFLEREPALQGSAVAAAEWPALEAAHGLVCTSPLLARLLAERLPGTAARVRSVCPGTDAAPRARGSRSGRLLTLSTITPRKGIRELVAAVAMLSGPDWSLDIVGSTDRDPDYARAVAADIGERDLGPKIRLHGELAAAALEPLYAAADVLVHTAHFEAFGMALAEAAAHCIPIVSTPAGALEMLPAGAYECVPAGDVAALSSCLDAVLSSPARLQAMQAAAATATLPDWDDAATAFATALGELLDP